MVGRQCGACLIQAALPSREVLDHIDEGSGSAESASAWPLDFHLPLGSSARASVFLVRDERVGGSVYRLKRWNDPASEGFLARFEWLRIRLTNRPLAGVVVPVAAYVDAAGRPVVLSPFVQGTPIVEAVTSGALDVGHGLELARTAADLLTAAHGCGLAHGGISPGNVIAHARSGSVYLLDFGMSVIWSPPPLDAAPFADDRGGMAMLLRRLRRYRRSRDHSL